MTKVALQLEEGGAPGRRIAGGEIREVLGSYIGHAVAVVSLVCGPQPAIISIPAAIHSELH
jgi:hypothetical protein